MAKTPWILKILSGTHIGAEVVLSTSEAVLGKDESCDLVLDDVSLAGKHISLSSDGSGANLTLLNTEKPIHIDGEEFSERTIRLNPFQVIRIGTLFLSAGPADAEWPPIDRLLGNTTEKGSDEDDTKPENGGDTAQKTEPKQDDSRGKSLPRRYLFAIGTLLIVTAFIALLYLLTTTERDVHDETFQQDTIDTIMQLADQYGAQLQISEALTDEGLIGITGYIDGELDRSRFLNQLRKIHIHVEVDLVSSEKTMHAIDAAINRFREYNEHNHVEVIAVADSPGDFVLRGYVQDKAKWLETVKALKHNIKGYRSLKDEVQTQEDRIAVLKQMLIAVQLGERVEVSATAEGVVLSGKLNQEEKKQLESVKETFNRKFNHQPEAVLATEEDTGNQSSVKLDIRAIGFSGHPHIIMRNGERYTEGAQLDNGYTITRITPEFILLTKDGKDEFFYLGSGPQ